jgi:hypothetical protein
VNHHPSSSKFSGSIPIVKDDVGYDMYDYPVCYEYDKYDVIVPPAVGDHCYYYCVALANFI